MGITTDTILLHPQNTPSSITEILDGISMDDRLEQYEKAYLPDVNVSIFRLGVLLVMIPMEVTLLGIVIDSKEEQSENAY